MPSPSSTSLALLALLAVSSSGASYGVRPALAAVPQVSVPAVPFAPVEAPPPDLPASAGPSATSGTASTAESYDEVGYASWYGDELRGQRTASGARFDPDWITAHRTLPLGSFVEVTSLDTGRTILLEITDRGPHLANRLIDLSMGAAKLLGVDRASIAPVRVRQVDPPAPDRVALGVGRPASTRLDSPEVLLAGLRARLRGGNVVTAAPPSPAETPRIVTTKAPPPTTHLDPPVVRKAPPPHPTLHRGYVVQVATFSDAGRAGALARRIGGTVVRAGKFTRVRLGPFADAGAADRARDGVAKRGYGDARVVRED